MCSSPVLPLPMKQVQDPTKTGGCFNIECLACRHLHFVLLVDQNSQQGLLHLSMPFHEIGPYCVIRLGDSERSDAEARHRASNLTKVNLTYTVVGRSFLSRLLKLAARIKRKQMQP